MRYWMTTHWPPRKGQDHTESPGIWVPEGRQKAVVVRFSRTRNRYERQGLLVEESALVRAEQECLADADARARMRERQAERLSVADARYRTEFAQRIRDLYPACPRAESVAIAEHACAKYSGRIGRTADARRFETEALGLAVRAHVRHVHTRYDSLLISGWDRHEARTEVTEEVERVLRRWSQPLANLPSVPPSA